MDRYHPPRDYDDHFLNNRDHLPGDYYRRDKFIDYDPPPPPPIPSRPVHEHSDVLDYYRCTSPVFIKERTIEYSNRDKRIAIVGTHSPEYRYPREWLSPDISSFNPREDFSHHSNEFSRSSFERGSRDSPFNRTNLSEPRFDSPSDRHGRLDFRRSISRASDRQVDHHEQRPLTRKSNTTVVTARIIERKYENNKFNTRRFRKRRRKVQESSKKDNEEKSSESLSEQSVSLSINDKEKDTTDSSSGSGVNNTSKSPTNVYAHPVSNILGTSKSILGQDEDSQGTGVEEGELHSSSSSQVDEVESVKGESKLLQKETVTSSDNMLKQVRDLQVEVTSHKNCLERFARDNETKVENLQEYYHDELEKLRNEITYLKKELDHERRSADIAKDKERDLQNKVHRLEDTLLHSGKDNLDLKEKIRRLNEENEALRFRERQYNGHYNLAAEPIPLLPLPPARPYYHPPTHW